jgi:acetyl esterase/lipase
LDEGVHFAKKLNKLNKPVETLIYNDSIHSFFFKPPMTTEKVTLEISAKIKAMIYWIWWLLCLVKQILQRGDFYI